MDGRWTSDLRQREWIMGDDSQANNDIDVLIVEDNDVNQMVFSFIMEELGLTFEVVANGEEAVAKYVEKHPPIIVMDVSMPVMNGFEATKKIRELEKDGGPSVTIIAATAHALKGDSERCIDAGMDDYIAKPISPDKLKEKLELWRERRAVFVANG